MTVIGTMLQLSDLHFSEDLVETGRSLWPKVLGYGLNSHSFGKIDALSAKMSELNLSGEGPEISLVTGDISTNGSLAALSTAFEFLSGGYIRTGKSNRIVTKGLGLRPEHRVIVPGNHDRYEAPKTLPTQKPNRVLEEVGGISQQYPYTVGFRKLAQRDDINYPAIIFFVFDSTITENAPFAKSHNPFYSIARGYIADAECRWLVEQVQAIKQTSEVTGVDGKALPVDYDAAIRIVALHHHPISDSGNESDGKWTLMENSKAFVDACFHAGIDLVLFGHQHKRKYRRMVRPNTSHGIHFFCCPSTSEFTETANGFSLFYFDTDRFEVDSYDWSDSSFVKNTAPPFSYFREIARRSSGRI